MSDNGWLVEKQDHCYCMYKSTSHRRQPRLQLTQMDGAPAQRSNQKPSANKHLNRHSVYTDFSLFFPRFKGYRKPRVSIVTV